MNSYHDGIRPHLLLQHKLRREMASCAALKVLTDRVELVTYPSNSKGATSPAVVAGPQRYEARPARARKRTEYFASVWTSKQSYRVRYAWYQNRNRTEKLRNMRFCFCFPFYTQC